MQATVRSFDEMSRSGMVLLDDGVELPFEAAAFDAGGLRLVRFGQRVQIRVSGDGPARHITALTLSTFPLP